MNIVELMVAILAMAIVFDVILYFVITKALKKNLRFEIERSKSKTWQKYTMGRSVHIVPENDIHEHVLTTGCGCTPKETPIYFGDNTVGWQYLHNALDGRSFS